MTAVVRKRHGQELHGWTSGGGSMSCEGSTYLYTAGINPPCSFSRLHNVQAAVVSGCRGRAAIVSDARAPGLGCTGLPQMAEAEGQRSISC